MKNKILFLGLALGMISLASCTSNNEVAPENTVDEKPTMTFTATRGNVDDSTRTALQNGTKLVWTEGDEIAVNGEKFTVSNISTDGQTATFTGPAVTAPYNAFYPYECFDSMSGTTINGHVQATQIYQLNSIGKGAFPMYATSNTTSLEFSNIAGILKLQIKGTDKISKIVVNKYGGVTPIASQYILTCPKVVTLDCSANGGVQLNATNITTFYISMAQFNAGATIDFLDENGKGMSKKVSSINPWSANKIVTMPEFVFTATEQIVGTSEQYQKATQGKGINIFFTIDGYTAAEYTNGTMRAKMVEATEAFFAQEPYTTYRDRFNVYFVYVNSESMSNRFYKSYTNSGNRSAMDNTDLDNCLSFIQRTTGVNTAGCLSVLLIKVDLPTPDTYVGSICHMWTDHTSLALVSMTNFFTRTVQHEAGGHGFANLADEYITNKDETITSADIDEYNQWTEYGWYKKVDIQKPVKWNYFSSYSYRYPDLEFELEGGYYYSYGTYRPSDRSIMNSTIHDSNGLPYGVEYYNAPSREEIYKQIMIRSGENTDPLFNDFITYDNKNTSLTKGITIQTNNNENITEHFEASPIGIINTK